MNPFKRTGFDTLIGVGMQVQGALVLAPQSTTLVQGFVQGPSITVAESGADPKNTTLVVEGQAVIAENIEVFNVTITGKVSCSRLIVHGTLAIKKGAEVTAQEVLYRNLVIEPGAILTAQMLHLDCIREAAPVAAEAASPLPAFVG